MAEHLCLEWTEPRAIAKGFLRIPGAGVNRPIWR